MIDFDTVTAHLRAELLVIQHQFTVNPSAHNFQLALRAMLVHQAAQRCPSPEESEACDRIVAMCEADKSHQWAGIVWECCTGSHLGQTVAHMCDECASCRKA